MNQFSSLSLSTDEFSQFTRILCETLMSQHRDGHGSGGHNHRGGNHDFFERNNDEDGDDEDDEDEDDDEDDEARPPFPGCNPQ